MGLRALLALWFKPPRPLAAIERYLKTGRSRSIDDLFDGWIELDDETEARLMDIHKRHGLKGDGFYGGLFQPEARHELSELARELRQEGK